MKIDVEPPLSDAEILRFKCSLAKSLTRWSCEKDSSDLFTRWVVQPWALAFMSLGFLAGVGLLISNSFWSIVGILICWLCGVQIFNKVLWILAPKDFVWGEIVSIVLENPTGCSNHDAVRAQVRYKKDGNIFFQDVQSPPFGAECCGDFSGEIRFEENDLIPGQQESWTLPVPVEIVYLRRDPGKMRLLRCGILDSASRS